MSDWWVSPTPTPSRNLAVEDTVREAARKHGVDEALALSVARQESGLQPDAKSPKGATGVMQLMPDTARSLGVNPSDTAQNIEGGVRYLKQMMDRYNGDVPKALAAYNAGPGAVDAGGELPAETRNYVPSVMGGAEAQTPADGEGWWAGPGKKVAAAAPVAPTAPAPESALDKVKKWGKTGAERAASIFTGPGTAFNEATQGTQEYAVPTVSPFQRPGLGSPAPKKDLPPAPMTPVNVANARVEDVFPRDWKAARGITRAGENLASGVANFTAVAPLAGLPAGAGRLVSAGFSADMVKNAWDQVPEFRKALEKPDTEDAWKTGAEILGSMFFGYKAGKHALRGSAGPAPPAKETAPAEAPVEVAPTPEEAAAAAIEVPPKPKFGKSPEERAAKRKFDIQERARVIKEKKQAESEAAKAKLKATQDAAREQEKQQKEAERVAKEAEKQAAEQAKQAQEAQAAELAAKIKGMPPAEVDQGIAEAVKALPDDQLREVAAAQELPKPPKEGEPEAPLPPLAEAVADELRARQTKPEGEPVAPAEPVQPTPTVAPNATVGAAPPTELGAPGGVDILRKYSRMNNYLEQADRFRRGMGDPNVPKEDRARNRERDSALLEELNTKANALRNEIETQLGRPLDQAPNAPPAPPALGSESVAPGGTAQIVPAENAGAKAEAPPLVAPVVPDPPHPLKKAYGPNWESRPDATELKKKFNAANSARQKGLKAYKAYVEESNARLAERKGKLTARAKELATGESGAVSPNVAALGIPELVKQDIAPAVKRVATGLTQTWDALKATVAPQSRSAEAKTTALSMREHMADRQRAYDITDKAFEPAHKLFDGIATHAEANPAGPERAQVTNFIDRMERGADQGSKDLNQIAGTLRGMLDQRRTDVQALGTGALENYIENYFPHLWKDPVKAKAIADQIFQQYFAKKPMEGNKGWLKKRTIDFFEEGIARGLEPVSWNPIDMVTARLVQMDKYIMAHRVFNELKGEGLLKFVRSGEVAPEGYREIEDRIATVYGPRKGAVKVPEGADVSPSDVTVYGQRIMGKYYAPEAAATVINNHLSPGLRGNNRIGPLFRTWIGASNWMNQFQLGFSAFHAGFTSIDAVVSKLALANIQASHGDIGKAAKSIAAAPASWITQPLGIGNKLIKEWDRPGSQGTEITELVDAMKAGGWRGHMDRMYRTRITDNMLRAFRSGNVLGGAWRAPFAAVEQASRPVLEWLVPRQKAAVVADLVRYEMERNPNMTRQQLREVSAKAVDSADNRMGQLAYDNLFWNKTFKDLAMASTRSVGWNLGTFRELGGGVLDLRKLASKNPELTYRASYVLALPVVVGTIGAVMHYMATGQAPQDLRDYYFPQTGNLDEHGRPERVSLPSYMKDIYHYSKEPGQTLLNKVHPALSTVAEMLQNRDYYGTKIWNEEDPLFQKMLDMGKHVIKAGEPFASRGLRRERDLGAPLSRQLAPFIGITPAPSSLNKTEAEETAAKYVSENLPRGSRTKVEAERSKLISELVRGTRLGQDVSEKQHEGLAQGIISRKDLKTIKSRAKLTPLERAFSGLSANEALDVYGHGSPEEQDKLRKSMQKKLTNLGNGSIALTPDLVEKAVGYGFRVPRPRVE